MDVAVRLGVSDHQEVLAGDVAQVLVRPQGRQFELPQGGSMGLALVLEHYFMSVCPSLEALEGSAPVAPDAAVLAARCFVRLE